MGDHSGDWQPGDPVHPAEPAHYGSCGPCLVRWTAEADRCPECGELSTEALRAALAAPGVDTAAPTDDRLAALLARCAEQDAAFRRDYGASFGMISTTEVRAALAARAPQPAESDDDEPVHLELYGISGTTDALADVIPNEPGGTFEARWLVNRAGQLLREAADMIRAAAGGPS